MYAIVDDMADNQKSFMKSYLQAYDKMTENGYTDTDLTKAPTNWFSHEVLP